MTISITKFGKNNLKDCSPYNSWNLQLEKRSIRNLIKLMFVFVIILSACDLLYTIINQSIIYIIMDYFKLRDDRTREIWIRIIKEDESYYSISK